MGWGQSIPQHLCGLGVAGISACRSWYRNVLASRSCHRRCCQVLFMSPGTSSHLLCAAWGAVQCLQMPPSPLTVSFRGALSPPSPATGKLLLHGWSKKEKLVVWVEVAKLL